MMEINAIKLLQYLQIEECLGINRLILIRQVVEPLNSSLEKQNLDS